MSEREKTPEELQNEIENLKKQVADLEEKKSAGELPQGEEEDDMANLLNNVMQFAGFDISSIQFEFLNTMINNIPNPVYYIDTKGIYLGCNHSYEKFIGRKFDQLSGKSISDILSKDVAEFEREKDNRLLKKDGLLSYEIQFKTREGTDKEILVSKSLIKNLDGTVSGIIAVINDITEKRAAERALVESENQLRVANATKDKFFSIISHDLKSPFVTLLGFTEMLNDDYDDFSEEERKGFIKDIQDSAQKSFGLMENLLQWSSSQRGKMKIVPEKLNLNELITEASDFLEPVAKQRKVNVGNNVAGDVTVFADKNTISFILRNLVSNAIKFNKEGGDVSIDASVEKDKVNVAIADTGIGISESDVAKLFRIDVAHKKIGKTTTNKGSGLGLILCKEFIDKNNGKIWAESEIEKGSKFSFSLPLE